MKRLIGTAFAALLAAVAWYTSPYWIYRLWSRDGLLGVEDLRPQGDLAAQALRGTPFSTFDLVIWAIAVFLILSVLQAIWARIFGS